MLWTDSKEAQIISKINFALHRSQSDEESDKLFFCQWLIAQLLERSLSVMKDPGANLGMDICSFRY
jgi:hypothetical protein